LSGRRPRIIIQWVTLAMELEESGTVQEDEGKVAQSFDNHYV